MARFLTQHREQYYFNLAVPSDLVTAIGKTKISEPLSFSFEEAEFLKLDRLKYWKEQFKETRTNGIPPLPLKKSGKTTLHGTYFLIQDYLESESIRITNQHLLDKQRFLYQWAALIDNYAPLSTITRVTASNYVKEYITPTTSSYRTKEKHLFALSSFFRWCCRSGLIESNPFTDMSFLLGKKTVATIKKPYSHNQLTQLLSAMPERLRVLSTIALYSGLRIEEICQLKTVDVNEGLEIKQGKNHNSIRVVPIHSALTDLINRLKATSPDGYLISNLTPAGRSNKRSHNISKQFGRYKTKLGFTKEHDFHSLRRTFATALENAGVPESTISQLMGHKKQSISLYLYSGGLEFTRLQQEIERISFESL